MTRRRHRASTSRPLLTGDTPRPGDEPVQPKPPPKPGPKPRGVDPDAVREVQARLRAEAEEYAATQATRTSGGRPTRLPVKGECHDCGRKVSGERRYCGPCVARH